MIINHEKTDEITVWDDFRKGDKDAYEFIYRTYAPLLYNYGYKITSDRELTQDCIQELFIKLLVSRTKIGKTDSIKFYLYKCLRRDLMCALRAKNKYVKADADIENQFNVVFSFEYELIEEQTSAERSAQLQRALDNLPPRQKEVIFLRFYENLSFEQISAVMGIEQSSVYKIIYKAIDNLHSRLLLEYAIVLIQMQAISLFRY
jgi:RNA polymerase sigma factor (sigma-70 family)